MTRDELLTLPKTQKYAVEIGSKHYFTGLPCVNGHVAERFTKSGTCYDCVRNKRNSVDTQKRKVLHPELAKEALEKGESTYIPTTPCKYGHMERFVLSGNCVECNLRIMRDRKEKVRNWRIEKVYGLSEDDIKYIHLVQNEACAICLTSTPITKMHVDHCHKSTKVRGLLCNKCNQALGLFKENLDTIQRAIDYLKLFK